MTKVNTVSKTKPTEIKTDVMALIQKRNLERKLAEQRENEIAERNERARAYSTKVSRSRKAKGFKENIEFIFAPIGILATLGGLFHIAMYILDVIISGGMM